MLREGSHESSIACWLSPSGLGARRIPGATILRIDIANYVPYTYDTFDIQKFSTGTRRDADGTNIRVLHQGPEGMGRLLASHFVKTQGFSLEWRTFSFVPRLRAAFGCEIWNVL